jgi:hypothetical protein
MFSLSKVFHHKVMDKGFRVSATAPASNPSNNDLVTASASNPSDSSSTSLIILWLSFL